MGILIQAAQLILSLSILVLLHELGHFIFAKSFRARVEKFYLFFDPWFSLFKKKVGETVYGIGWLPLGGYVKIAGMIDESLDKEAMKLPPKPYEFRSKPAWQRLLIMLGGVVMNFILAIIIYASILYTWGETYLPAKNATYGIMVDSVAMNMGLQNGDKILAVDGKPTDNFLAIFHDIVVYNAKTLRVDRSGKIIDIEIPESSIAPLLKSATPILPRVPFYIYSFPKNSSAEAAGLQKNDRIISVDHKPVMFYDEFKTNISGYKNKSVPVDILRNEKDTLAFNVNVDAEGRIGVYPDMNMGRYFELKDIDYSFIQAIPAGIKKGLHTIDSYLKQLKLLLRPETKAYESLGGFIKIGSIFSKVWDWQSFWSMTALLSIILAIMNILPIPALDGGHVMFLFYEMITGRKPGDKFLEYAQIAGMIFILGLILYANGNDIIQLFKK